jgi:type I phosphodiesterase/nucleotide pyrophosphatase
MSSILAFFRKLQSWPIILIPLGLLVWAGFVAPVLVRESFYSLVYFDSHYQAALPAGHTGEPIAEQVVIVVIDGLRVDASQRMPTLNQMRALGADRVALVGQPSLSKPGWTTIGTGAWPEQSSITSNFPEKAIALDTLFLAAKRKGLNTALVGIDWWHQLYPLGVDYDKTIAPMLLYPDTDQASLLSSDQAVTSSALEVLKRKPNLVIIHLLAPDIAAHHWGGVSEQYMEVVQNADSQLAYILAALDLNTTTLFVTADHGHLDQGGHGGGEPMVMRVPLVSVGKGIRVGTYSIASLTDIAPTVAVLLGTSIPAHNQGDILFDQLDATDSVKATRAVDLAQQLIVRYEAMLKIVSERPEVNRELLNRAEDALQKGDYATARNLSEQSNGVIRAQWTAARNHLLNHDRMDRLPLALLMLTPAALYLVMWKRARWSWQAPIVGAIEYFVAWNGFYFGVYGHGYSFSILNTEAASLPLLIGARLEAMFALMAAMVVVGILRRKSSASEIGLDAVNTLFLVATVMGIQLLIFYVAWGVVFTKYLPNLNWGLKFFLDMLQTTAFWPTNSLPLAILLPYIALLTTGVAKLAISLKDLWHRSISAR